ncbi:MAG TPA: thiamine phosphate synthase [Sphingomicrobium sp.]|jgi:thiamine-phosphate pyrophosphorylase
MTARQRPWPQAWLMTDERIGERLWEAIDHLPIKHAGIVFRHYKLPPDDRAQLARRIADICERRGLALAIAADANLARTLGADLVHNPPEPPVDLPFSRSVHSLAEAEAAKADGAALVLVSPIFTTRSHPDRKPLGLALARRIARTAGVPAIALGGMTERKFSRVEREGFYGWAGIDAWLGEERA